MLRLLTSVVCALLLLPEPMAEAARRPRLPRTTRATATAYCQDGRTTSGLRAREGIVAADPSVWPIGSKVHITTPGVPYSGVYTVMDTGRSVKGPKIDIFIDSCRHAKRFGRRVVQIRALSR